MKVICLEEEAFYALIEEVVKRLKEEPATKKSRKRWIDGQEVMRILQIRTTTLQKYRDEGKIRFSQPSRKVIIYDRYSIEAFIEKNVKEPF